MTEQDIHVTTPKPIYVPHKSGIEVGDVESLTDGLSVCSSAFIQFSQDCPNSAARMVLQYMDKGWIKIKTAKIGMKK